MSFILKTISNKKQLRWLIIIFFLLLALPSSFLINSSLQQLKWQQIYQYQNLADEFSNRINNEFKKSLHNLESLSIDDFNFLKLEGDAKRNYLQRSRLSEFPINMHEQGVIGYFQVDNKGRFSTPLLPNKKLESPGEFDDYSVSAKEYILRKNLENKLFEVLLKNQLIKTDMEKYTIKVNEKKDTVKTELLKEINPGSEKKQPGRLKHGQGSDSRTLTAANTAQPKSVPQSQAAFDSLVKIPASKITEKPDLSSRSKVERAPLLNMVENSEKSTLKQGSIAINQSSEMQDEESVSDNNFKKSMGQNDRSKDKINGLTGLKVRKDIKTKNIKNVIYAEKIKDDIKKGLAKQGELGSRYRIKIFETKIEPFELAKLETGELVLFRKAWRDNARLIQGMIIEPHLFLKKMIGDDFNHTSLSELGVLSVFYGKEKLAEYNNHPYNLKLSMLNENDQKIPKFKLALSEPFSQLTLVYHLQRIPLNAGAGVIYMVAAIFMLVLVLGFIILYRLLLKQLVLAQQQQDFVSSVSHELKTPLTSIRMYGEMLLQNWVSEDKKKSYYQYIFDESERLSRLISNVLQLSSISRDALQLNIKSITVLELMDLVTSKVISQVENSGYKLKISQDESLNNAISVQIDVDAFVQIIINLVDNGIKFSRHSDKKQIDISCKQNDQQHIVFLVRDYGQGIEDNQMKKIFQLFYRTENELTRETVGTGIGLSLVHSLARAMYAEVDVVNAYPGAEFSIELIAKRAMIG